MNVAHFIVKNNNKILKKNLILFTKVSCIKINKEKLKI